MKKHKLYAFPPLKLHTLGELQKRRHQPAVLLVSSKKKKKKTSRENFLLQFCFRYADILSDNEVISVALNYIHLHVIMETYTQCTQKPLIHTLIQRTKHVTDVLLQKDTDNRTRHTPTFLQL